MEDFVSQLTIFDDILHCKNAWDSVSAETIVKCFRHSAVYEFDASPPCSPESTVPHENHEADTDFDEYFQNLLGIPWEEYLMMDEELEAKNPSCAPDGNTCADHVQDLLDQDQEPMPTVNEILQSSKLAQ